MLSPKSAFFRTQESCSDKQVLPLMQNRGAIGVEMLLRMQESLTFVGSNASNSIFKCYCNLCGFII